MEVGVNVDDLQVLSAAVYFLAVEIIFLVEKRPFNEKEDEHIRASGE